MILLLLDFVPSDTLWVSFTILELEDSDNGDNGDHHDDNDYDNGDDAATKSKMPLLEVVNTSSSSSF